MKKNSNKVIDNDNAFHLSKYVIAFVEAKRCLPGVVQGSKQMLHPMSSSSNAESFDAPAD